MPRDVLCIIPMHIFKFVNIQINTADKNGYFFLSDTCCHNALPPDDGRSRCTNGNLLLKVHLRVKCLAKNEMEQV